MIPEGVIARVGISGVEAHLVELPMLLLADSGGEGRDVVVGMVVAERVLGGIKEILSVNE